MKTKITLGTKSEALVLISRLLNPSRSQLHEFYFEFVNNAGIYTFTIKGVSPKTLEYIGALDGLAYTAEES